MSEYLRRPWNVNVKEKLVYRNMFEVLSENLHWTLDAAAGQQNSILLSWLVGSTRLEK